MAGNDEFYDLIHAQAEYDPGMKKLLASTEGMLQERPPVESQGYSDDQVPVARLVVFNNDRVMLQISDAANPEILLAALHHAVEVVEERFQSDED